LFFVAGPAWGGTLDDAYTGLPMAASVGVAERWCDFAKHAASWQRVAVEADPVFRQAGAQDKADLGAAVKGGDVAGLAKVFGRTDGPALARLALTDKVPEVRRRGWLAAVQAGLMQRHPRLAGLGVDDLKAQVAALATAAAAGFLATGCDMAALYVLDALDNAEAAQAVVAEIARVRALQRRPDIGLVRRLLAWVERPGAESITRSPARVSENRVAALQLVAQTGWMPEAGALARLSADADPAVAAAALIALARAHPHAAAGRARSLLASTPRRATPLHRAAVHALALADPMDPRTDVVLEKLAAKGSPLRNDAERALAYVRLD
jgi:hypothetical protein